MTKQQAAEWKADRQRRAQEMKARLLSAPDLTAQEKMRAAEFGRLVVKAKAYRDQNGWNQGG